MFLIATAKKNSLKFIAHKFFENYETMMVPKNFLSVLFISRVLFRVHNFNTKSRFEKRES